MGDRIETPFPDGARFCLSLTYDIEMCTNFPYWTSVWDHRKGAIDEDTKQYIERLAEIAGEAGVKCQWFVVGKALEDDDLGYLEGLVAAGHAVGNHTYRHVNVKAQAFEDLQVTYRRDPGLAAGHESPLAAIRAEIRQTTAILGERLGQSPRGFRTPGGFGGGLADVPAVCELLAEEGFGYVSADYRYPITREPPPTWDELAAALEWSVTHLQPYRYPNGLLEIPMMGISDIWAFRVLDLEREQWIRLLEHGIDVAAERGLAFSILMHPATMASRDPHGATIRRLLQRAAEKGGWVTTNDALAERYAAGPAEG